MSRMRPFVVGVGFLLLIAAPSLSGGQPAPSAERTPAESLGALEAVREALDEAWNQLARLVRSGEPRHIAAYHGYGNGSYIWVQGRLLANEPQGGPKEDDGWWQNLIATINRWHTDEIAGAELRLNYAGTLRTVTTDDDGYYRVRFPIDAVAPETDTVTAWHEGGEGVLMANHRLTLLDEDARFMVISDMDDTVIHTGITDLLLRVQLTFLNNARTRKPLTGVSGLYRALAKGDGTRPVNPIFYLSNAAWNMYDLMSDFLDLNELPAGPLLLRDTGWGGPDANHKIETLRDLFLQFESLPVILIGDSGQHDAEIYSRIAEENPGRVKAIYIRDIDPSDTSEYDGKVDQIIERSQRLGVPFLRIQDSNQIARHATEISLLPRSDLPEIATEVAQDRRRETLADETTAGIGGEK